MATVDRKSDIILQWNLSDCKKSEATEPFKAGSKCVPCLQNILGKQQKNDFYYPKVSKKRKQMENGCFYSNVANQREKSEAHKAEKQTL